MSESGRAQVRAWRSYAVLGTVAIAALFAVAVSRSIAMPLAVAGAILVAAFAVYFGTSRRNVIGNVAAPESARETKGLSGAALDILEVIDDPLLVLDDSGRIVFANRASKTLVGPDAGGKRISAVLRTPELLETVERILAGGGPENVAFSVLVPVQHHYEAYVACTGGRLILMRIRDVSAIRRAEELRADFVANASHELRTPLAAITGFIDTLRGHARDDPSARERFLEIMSTEAGRMRRLIDDLLSLTRIELNEHNPPAGEVDVVAVVRDAADALKPLADSDRIRLDIAASPALPIVGDRDEVTQVFQNLMHNAIKYGRPGGEVRVRFGRTHAPSRRDSGMQAFVSIEDEGEGIPREAIPRLTERFYRVDVKRSRERGGTGLGLAIVKHILNRHRGRLQIESVPGQGSIFTVFLPAAPDGSN